MAKAKVKPYPDAALDGRPATAEPAALLLPPLDPAPPNGYCPRHVDVRLTSAEASTARRLLEALQRDQATLTDSQRPLRSLGDLVRWIFQQIGTSSD
jgi:hypothetical protein